MSSASSMSLPPPPQTFAGAPGQQPYDTGASNGQGNPAHMPPPLPPVVIPQNTNPIPTAMTSPIPGDSTGMMSPSSATSSFIRRAAPEPNKRALYVGGLDPRVTEDILRQIFETTGHVQNVKIIPDKNVGAVSLNPLCVQVIILPASSSPECPTSTRVFLAVPTDCAPD
jgi:nucleolysin TIA-1/TIAR